MGRLTSWNKDCVQINGHALNDATRGELVQMAERLAAYEDTGLEPEAVETVKLALAAKHLVDLETLNNTPISRLVELAEADKDGRVLILPCKVGDTVWFKTYKNSARECIGIQPHEVTRISVDIIVPGEFVDIGIPVEQIGDRVFLSKAEAAAADAESPDGSPILDV